MYNYAYEEICLYYTAHSGSHEDGCVSKQNETRKRSQKTPVY